ncbi:MAG: T9SS type A sorting domain-containing protein [Candidatus Marinimicrobia bacterium]|nr:T9SS type A sorting domain-containing protein [Candidatus Neomarinimicrobiota bacterium]
MKNLLRMTIMLVLVTSLAFAVIPRVAEFAPPDTSMNVGGTGNLIAGVDVDGDGATEIYWINDNWNDSDAGELIPKIYKLERAVGETDYEVVWMANAQDFDPTITQNTWPTLALTDLDDDGKMELTWGIVNAGSGNPYRIWVYEHAGGDNFGIQNPTTLKWEPHSVWTIADADGVNIRPVSWKVTDIDADGVDEIIFASRKSGLTFGICSVDDIPDDGAGTEAWTMEYSQADVASYGGDNKWDVAVIGSSAYFFDEVKISKVKWTGTEYVYSEMDPLPGGISFDAAQSCDVDDDGTNEILVAEYFYGDTTRMIWLCYEIGDTLNRVPLFDLAGTDYLDGGRIIGGDHGDIDGDGNMDFVFGSRYSGPPNAMMFRVEYDGSGEIIDPANWELTFADTGSLSSASGGIWSVIDIANVDDDVEDEVVYTSSVSAGSFTYPIIILDNDYRTSVRNILNPISFELGEAYPNPFNPATIIPFTLEESGMVTLIVFNVKGERVSTLISSDRMESGHHNVMFDASDLASGVYVYQLQVDNTVRAAKMVLNK